MTWNTWIRTVVWPAVVLTVTGDALGADVAAWRVGATRSAATVALAALAPSTPAVGAAGSDADAGARPARPAAR